MFELLASQAVASLRSLVLVAKTAYSTHQSESLSHGGAIDLEDPKLRSLLASSLAANSIERELNRAGATLQSLESFLRKRVSALVGIEKPGDAVLFVQALKLLPVELGVLPSAPRSPKFQVSSAPMILLGTGSPEVAETPELNTENATFTAAEVNVLETSLYFATQHGRIEWSLFRELCGRLQLLKGSPLRIEEELAELPQAQEVLRSVQSIIEPSETHQAV